MEANARHGNGKEGWCHQKRTSLNRIRDVSHLLEFRSFRRVSFFGDVRLTKRRRALGFGQVSSRRSLSGGLAITDHSPVAASTGGIEWLRP